MSDLEPNEAGSKLCNEIEDGGRESALWQSVHECVLGSERA